MGRQKVAGRPQSATTRENAGAIQYLDCYKKVQWDSYASKGSSKRPIYSTLFCTLKAKDIR